jgi:hypothetical protein
MLVLGIALIATGLALAYAAGADPRHRADWEAHADHLVDGTADSRGRHPSRLGERA